jgi:GTP pyrophosphokinase
MTSQRSAVNPVLEPLVAVHREVYPKADLALLQRAYEVAEKRHADQLRRSGDPYITHPLAVANILAELGMDTTTLVAALLHDTVEDTGVTLDSITADFGPEVAHLVDGVTKIDKVKLGDAAQAETIRKMIVAMARDPRVLVIKLADRLHNMRTLRFLPPEKQEKKARETLEILAPLAHRDGAVGHHRDVGLVGDEGQLLLQVFPAVGHRIQVGHGADRGVAAPGGRGTAGADGFFIRKTRLTKMHMHIGETGKNKILI